MLCSDGFAKKNSKSFLAIFPPCFQNFRAPKVPTLTKIPKRALRKRGLLGTFGDFRAPKVPTLTKISQKSPTKAGPFGALAPLSNFREKNRICQKNMDIVKYL